MPLHRAPLFPLGIVLGSFVVGAFCDPPPHSLSYSYLRLSEPTQGQNQFFMRGYLDDQPIIRFDSLTWKVEPLVPWMEEVEKETFLAPEWVFRADLEKLSKRDHSSGGLHTWQVNLGCELREDGSKRGFLHYGYHGRDFISFDKETLRWLIAQPKAVMVKEKWENDTRWSEGNKVYLEETCIGWLQRYLSYQKEALQRIDPPVGKVTRKVVDDSLEVLVCQAFGFYPKEIQATWTRDGEVCQYETLHRNVVPNSDGTYYVWLSIEIDPKERDRFTCHLDHEGLRRPLELAFKEETAMSLVHFMTLVTIIILASVTIFLIYYWRKGKLHQARTSCLDHLLEKRRSSPPSGTEDDVQSQATFPPKRTSEGCFGQKTELRKGERRPLMASSDAYSDNKEGAAVEISEGGQEESLEDAEATKPGMEGLEEEVSPGSSEGASEEQALEHLAGKGRDTAAAGGLTDPATSPGWRRLAAAADQEG